MRINLSLDEITVELLDARALEWGVSRSDVVRRLARRGNPSPVEPIPGTLVRSSADAKQDIRPLPKG